MGVYAKGTALIINRETGEAFEISSEELEFEPFKEALNEKEIGQRHQAQIDHPVLGALVWTIWEYPQGVERMKATNSNEHAVERDFDYGLVPVKEHPDFAPPVSNIKVPANQSSKSKFVKSKPKAKAKAKPKAKAKVKAKKKPVSKKAQKRVTKPKKAKKSAKKKAVKRVTKSKKRVKKKK